MTDNDRFFSLLSYLDAQRGNFHLKFTLTSDDSTTLEKAPFPFLTLTDTDPLTRLIEARLRTDAGSDIDRVFLLVQRDRYLLAKDELRPVNNREVEEAWQEAFSFYASEQKDPSFICLANQLDESGKLTQCSPLFFCKTKQLYFHPPCPKCGLPLQQCEDDDLLGRSGLLPYSGSLKRYLYCRSCTSSGTFDFYVYEREPSDPPALRDCRALIREFKLLIEHSNIADRFPCIECPNHKECYGPDQHVTSRIAPLSFYPFYMFIFKAMSLHALDFLPLVSGAAFQELESELAKKGESGRIACLETIRQDTLDRAPCLFDSDERFFLEVLYLKLSFLGEVFQGISSEQDLFRHPDLRLSIDRMWVKLSDHGSLLPFMWNFRVKFIDIFSHQTDRDPSAGIPDSNGLFFMGLLSFHALLVNKQQDMSQVSLSLKEITDKYLSDDRFSFTNCIDEGVYSVFLPAHIFWNPAGKTVNRNWHPLWTKSLHAGWSLLKAAYLPAPEFSREHFLKELEEIREEVRSRLFAEVPAYEQQNPPKEDKAILGILNNIYDKWSSAGIQEEEEVTETVVLAPEGPGKETAPPPPSEEERDIIRETVIISKDESQAPSKPTDAEQPKKDEEVPQETVIISTQGTEGAIKPLPEVEQKKPDEVPPETVIISPRDVRGTAKPSGEQPKVSIPSEEAGRIKDQEEQKKQKKTEEDILTETVILKPGKLKDKGKNGKK
jgi:hypothetical protein